MYMYICIYVLDAKNLNTWLNGNGILAHPQP